MKNLIAVVVFAITMVSFPNNIFAQDMAKHDHKDKMDIAHHDHVNADVTIIELTQTPGEFNTKNLNLEPGKYQFRIVNESVEKEVGFVIQKETDKDGDVMKTGIKEAFASSLIKKGDAQYTGIVDLTAGDYVYSCPLNPTPKYNITVAEKVQKGGEVTIIELTQTPGEFDTQSLNLKPGKYQFRIVNENVDKELGFVIQKAADKDGDVMKTGIKESFTSALIKKGDVQYTGVVELGTGDYIYSCPLNPTPKYSITVK